MVTFLLSTDVPVLLSSNVEIRGFQFNLTGGGTFSYNPVTSGQDATADIAPYFFNSLATLKTYFKSAE